jgi:hypothetical protein
MGADRSVPDVVRAIFNVLFLSSCLVEARSSSSPTTTQVAGAFQLNFQLHGAFAGRLLCGASNV